MLARRLMSTQLVAQMLSISFNTVANVGSAKPSVKPISKCRAVISAQAPAQWVRGLDCCSSQTEQNTLERRFLSFSPNFYSRLSISVDTAALCIIQKTQFIKSNDMWNISVRITHNYKHNCIIASRWGIKQNNTFIKRLLNGCIHQIITACRLNEMRLIKRPLENGNIIK